MEDKAKKVEALKNELAEKLLNEIIPECRNLFATKGFNAAIAHAVNQGIHFANIHIQKYL